MRCPGAGFAGTTGRCSRRPGSSMNAVICSRVIDVGVVEDLVGGDVAGVEGRVRATAAAGVRSVSPAAAGWQTCRPSARRRPGPARSARTAGRDRGRRHRRQRRGVRAGSRRPRSPPASTPSARTRRRLRRRPRRGGDQCPHPAVTRTSTSHRPSGTRTTRRTCAPGGPRSPRRRAPTPACGDTHPRHRSVVGPCGGHGGSTGPQPCSPRRPGARRDRVVHRAGGVVGPPVGGHPRRGLLDARGVPAPPGRAVAAGRRSTRGRPPAGSRSPPGFRGEPRRRRSAVIGGSDHPSPVGSAGRVPSVAGAVGGGAPSRCRRRAAMLCCAAGAARRMAQPAALPVERRRR